MQGSGTPSTSSAGQALVTPTAGVRDLFELVRPAQWIKNVVIFAGPAAALELFSWSAAAQTLGAFAAFCLVASAGYALNDALDHKADALHPTKCERPVARGTVTVATAYCLALVLFVLGTLLSALLVNARVTTVLVVYSALTAVYSLTLKKRVIVDVMVVALGFVLRAWAGALAVGIEASLWFIACVFTLCLFMGFGKRRCEIAMIGNAVDAGQHRRTLLRYTPELLNHLITVSAGIAVITFLLYTMDTGGHPTPFPKNHLFFTLPVVIYGVFRFAMLTELGMYAGPTEIVLKDRPMLWTFLLWTALAMLIAYQFKLFGAGGLAGLIEIK